jgi:hypothetical protein
MNRDNQFQNSASQAERRRMLQQDQASTFERARVSEAIDSERSKSAVSGTKPVVDYLPIPSGPWSAGYWANVPDEPPLGYAINEQEPVGTPAEVERSLQDLAGAQAPTLPLASGDVVEDGSSHPTPTPATPDDRPVKLKLKRLPK